MEWYHYLIAYFVLLMAINIVINIVTVKIGYYHIMKTLDESQLKDIELILTIIFTFLTFGTEYLLKELFKIEISNLCFFIFITLLLFTPKIAKIIYIHNKRKRNQSIPHKSNENEFVETKRINYYDKYFKKKNTKSKEDKRKEALEKEMDLYNLEEWEKEEVRKGNFRPENFEDSEGIDDLEDDDYHFEDD